MSSQRLTIQKQKERRKDVREMTYTQAQEELVEKRRLLFDLRLQMQRGEVRNNREFARARKDIAMLKYHMRMLEVEVVDSDTEPAESSEETAEE